MDFTLVLFQDARIERMDVSQSSKKTTLKFWRLDYGKSHAASLHECSIWDSFEGKVEIE
jgi:hypothetical protein